MFHFVHGLITHSEIIKHVQDLRGTNMLPTYVLHICILVLVSDVYAGFVVSFGEDARQTTT